MHNRDILLWLMQAHPAMTLKKRNSRAKQYAEGGRNLGGWSMWVALETYMQVRETARTSLESKQNYALS